MPHLVTELQRMYDAFVEHHARLNVRVDYGLRPYESPDTFVALKGDRVIGMVLCNLPEGDSFIVSVLFVEAEHRRCGAGRALLAAAAAHALRHNRRMVLLVVSDAEARKFYLGLGFREWDIYLSIEADRLIAPIMPQGSP